MKKRIVVGFNSFDNGYNKYMDLKEQLEKSGISIIDCCIGRVIRTYIETEHCVISFIPSYRGERTWLGLVADACFDVPEYIQCIINRDHKVIDPELKLFDYIVQNEGIYIGIDLASEQDMTGIVKTGGK